jgi:hypothetical protein
MRSTTKKRSPLSASNAKRLEDRLEDAFLKNIGESRFPRLIELKSGFFVRINLQATGFHRLAYSLIISVHGQGFYVP